MTHEWKTEPGEVARGERRCQVSKPIWKVYGWPHLAGRRPSATGEALGVGANPRPLPEILKDRGRLGWWSTPAVPVWTATGYFNPLYHEFVNNKTEHPTDKRTYRCVA